MRSTTLSVKPLARIRSMSHARPTCPVEREQPLLGQRGEELDREERIARGLLVHQLGQRPHAARVRVQGHRRRAARHRRAERRKHDLLDSAAGLADRLQRPHQRVRGADLVVAVGADQQEVPHLRLR